MDVGLLLLLSQYLVLTGFFKHLTALLDAGQSPLSDWLVRDRWRGARSDLNASSLGCLQVMR